MASILDGRRTELIDGEIIEMPPIGTAHLVVVDRLERHLACLKAEDRLQSGQPVRVRDFDEPQPDLTILRQLGDWHALPGSEVVLREGVPSARSAIVGRLSLCVWIEAPAGTRLGRGLDRDGVDRQPLWQRRMAEEAAHQARDRTRDRADLSVDGAPSVLHDPEVQFVCLSGRRNSSTAKADRPMMRVWRATTEPLRRPATTRSARTP